MSDEQQTCKYCNDYIFKREEILKGYHGDCHDNSKEILDDWPDNQTGKEGLA